MKPCKATMNRQKPCVSTCDYTLKFCMPYRETSLSRIPHSRVLLRAPISPPKGKLSGQSRIIIIIQCPAADQSRNNSHESLTRHVFSVLWFATQENKRTKKSCPTPQEIVGKEATHAVSADQKQATLSIYWPSMMRTGALVKCAVRHE